MGQVERVLFFNSLPILWNLLRLGNGQGVKLMTLSKWWSGQARAAFARGILGLLALAALGYVVFGAKPWEIDLWGKHRVERFVACYGWFAAGLSALVCAGLAILAPWWAGGEVRSNSPSSPSSGKWFWLLLLAAAGFSAFSAWPRLTHGLWDDEDLNVRLSIVGRFRPSDGNGPVEFRPNSWMQTAFEYREPNNHPLNSILARLAHESWRAVARPDGLPIAEWPLRLPAFFAAVGGVVALGWMLSVYGMPMAGILAAWLMALHPWHLRYAAECRGYGFALLLVPMLLGCWGRAARTGAGGWWAAFAVVQILLVWAYPGTLFLLVVLNAVAVLALALDCSAAGPFPKVAGRWFAANALAACAGAFLLLPMLGQVGPWVKVQSEQGFGPGPLWLWSTFNHFLLGAGWWKGSTPSLPRPDVVNRMGDWLPLYGVFVAIVLVAVAMGIVRWWRQGWIARAALAAILLPPWMTFGYAAMKTLMIYEPYVIYALPGVVALAASGILWLFERMGRRWCQGAIVFSVALYAILVWPLRHWMISHPLQQIREAVLASRGTLNPWDEASGKFLTGSFSIPAFLYDPRGVRLDSVAAFVDFLRRADAEGRPLEIHIGMPWAARDYSPGMWSLVNDGALFESPRVFPGWDPGLDRMLFRYRPGSAQSYDFSEALKLQR